MGRYHFLTVEANARGTSVVTLPGQAVGRTPVTPCILVTDARGTTAVTRARRKASPGDILFTTTLRRVSHGYTASDLLPLEGHGNVLYADAEDRYREYLSGLNDGPSRNRTPEPTNNTNHPSK